MAGITATGFIKKSRAEIQTELESKYQAAFGSNINLDPRSPFGQIIAIHADREAALWDLAESIYNSNFADTAFGSSLDNVASNNAITRLEATRSEVEVTFSGDNGTVIPVGFLVSVDNYPERQFATTEEVTISGGTAVVLAQAVNTGEVIALAGTITVIDNPATGVDSVTNTLDAEGGRDVETDAELRARRFLQLQVPGTSSTEGVRSALLALDFVNDAFVITNRTDSTVDSRPAHSSEAFVDDGGDSSNNEEIALTILNAKPEGAQHVGDVVINVTDSQGFIQEVKFSRPSEIDIYIDVDITKNTDISEGDLYPATGDDLVLEKILDYGSSLIIARDVIVNRIIQAISEVPGVIGVAITLKAGSPPSGSDTSNIPIDFDEKANFDSAFITVTSS